MASKEIALTWGMKDVEGDTRRFLYLALRLQWVFTRMVVMVLLGDGRGRGWEREREGWRRGG